MSDEQQKTVEDLINSLRQKGDAFDKIMKDVEQKAKSTLRLSWILISLIVASIFSMGLGASKMATMQSQINEINRNYIPMMFMRGMLINQEYKMEEMVMRFTGAPKADIDGMCEKYDEFRNTMTDQMIEMKQALSDRTRGASPGRRTNHVK